MGTLNDLFHDNSRRWITAAVASMTLLGTAACSEHPEVNRTSNGPVSIGSADEESHLCTPGVRSSDVMYTANTVSNRGDVGAVITSVSLMEAEGLEIADALIVPIRRNPADGTWTQMAMPPEWPPPMNVQKSPGVGWPERKEAVGATITPGTNADGDPKQILINLVLHLRRSDPNSLSRFSGLRIEYEIGDSKFSNEARTAFTVTNGECPK